MRLVERARALGETMIRRGWREEGAAAPLLSRMRKEIRQHRRPSADQCGQSVAWRWWAPEWAVVLGRHSKSAVVRAIKRDNSSTRQEKEHLFQRRMMLLAARDDEELRGAMMTAHLLGKHEMAWELFLARPRTVTESTT